MGRSQSLKSDADQFKVAGGVVESKNADIATTDVDRFMLLVANLAQP